MNLPMFDQSKIYKDDNSNSLSGEGESIRLSNELRSHPSQTIIDVFGLRVDIPAKQGFDCETADFITMVNWLADSRIKKSESLIAFVHRILAVRFPTEYSQHKNNIDSRYKLEYEMIQSHATNDIHWLGQVGFQNMVRLDKSLTLKTSNTIKNKNEEFEVKRI